MYYTYVHTIIQKNWFNFLFSLTLQASDSAPSLPSKGDDGT